MKKLIFLISSVLLFSCQKDDIEPMVITPKVETIPTKPIEYRYEITS